MKVESYASNKEGGVYTARPSGFPQDTNIVLVRPGQDHGMYEIIKQFEVLVDIRRAVTSQPVTNREKML